VKDEQPFHYDDALSLHRHHRWFSTRIVEGVLLLGDGFTGYQRQHIAVKGIAVDGGGQVIIHFALRIALLLFFRTIIVVLRNDADAALRHRLLQFAQERGLA